MNIKSFLAIILLLLPFFGNSQNAWTLEQCIDTALVNNRRVKQQLLTKEARAIAYNQARQELLPNLNASAGQSFSFGRSLTAENIYQSANSSSTSFSVSTSLTLFDGLRIKHNIDARRADMNASEADLEKIHDDIIMSVTTAFLQVLMNKELLQIAKEQIQLTQKNIEQRESLVESGKMAEGELYELYAQEAQEELNIIQADNSLKLSLLDLAQILELSDFENLDIITPDDLITIDASILPADSVYRSALTHRPEIRGAEYRLESSERNVSIIKSSYYPSLSFGAQMGTDYYNLKGIENSSFSDQISNNLRESLGFSLQIPIFNRFDTRNRVRTAKLEVESSRIAIEDVKIELRKNIQQAYQNALAAKTRWIATQKSEMAVREAYRFVNQKYEAGRASQYELFQAKNNLTKTLSEQTQAKYEFAFRMRILEILK